MLKLQCDKQTLEEFLESCYLDDLQAAQLDLLPDEQQELLSVQPEDVAENNPLLIDSGFRGFRLSLHCKLIALHATAVGIIVKYPNLESDVLKIISETYLNYWSMPDCVLHCFEVARQFGIAAQHNAKFDLKTDTLADNAFDFAVIWQWADTDLGYQAESKQAIKQTIENCIQPIS